MEKIKRNKVFRLFSSVKLAVPLMFVVTCSVAGGTIVESRYNTDLARLLVYRTWWFQFLLALLFLNILCAALSRIPYKKHHTGFVITHIGMLTLLTGALITNNWGVDGQLRIDEGTQGNTVVLSDLVFEVINKQTENSEVFPVQRKLEPLNFEQLGYINEKISGKFSVVSYLPYAKVERVFKTDASSQNNVGSGPIAVSFRLKSAFFDVTEWLNSKENPDFQMGPAHLSLLVHGKDEQLPKGNDVHLSMQHGVKPNAAASKNSPAQISSKGKHSRLQILSIKENRVLKDVSLKELQQGPLSIGPITVTLRQIYQQAMVGGKNKIEEGGKPGANPALELVVEHQGQKEREVVYSKFPTFSMHKDGVFGLSFKYTSQEGEVVQTEAKMPPARGEMPNDSVHSRVAAGGMAPTGGGNTIQFHAFELEPEKILVKLLKGGQEVLSQWAKPGDVIQTPWMGIKIFLNQVVRNGVETQEVKPTELMLRSEMPPAAILVRPNGGGLEDGAWLVEGDARDLVVNNVPYQIYFGRRTFRLPFQVLLEKFTKTDYPGTQTPMSFESMVSVNGLGQSTKISMNEPMTMMGYTLYQASYVMQPGVPVASIFSVNWDPGRPVKYTGSLILVVGIITFTLMRSRLAKLKRETS